MVDSRTGYFRIGRFAATTYDEFMDAARKFKSKGMQQVIIDVRGNPGGYLDAATRLADEFISDGKSIVYTEGKSRPRADYIATAGGMLETARVVVLIDEGSASASEILAGALQDWDRGTIIGRRSFGKGLVQEQTVLPDGSAIRLTIARYYTPTGRSIQKPYENGSDAYHQELESRMEHQELLNQDSIRFPDSLKYKTPGGKIVYGGGGIMPDIFIPIDTSDSKNTFLLSALSSGSVPDFSYEYVDRERVSLQRFKDVDAFVRGFNVSDALYQEFVKSVPSVSSTVFIPTEVASASKYLKNQIKANISRQLFRGEGFYPVWLQLDPTFIKAVEVLGKKPD
jgi:carboxyl-terminal processing protease